MNIHEYQAKEVLKKYGVAVPRGLVATTSEEAEAAAASLGTPVVVVKAQIHAGGRGKAGGVKVVKSPAEGKAAAAGILGKKLVTHQTGPEGKEVLKVYVEEGCRIARELYLGLTLDRDQGRLAMMASTEGGVDIDEDAREHPEKILKEWIDPLTGLLAFQARRMAFGLGLKGDSVGSFVKFAMGLHAAYATICGTATSQPIIGRYRPARRPVPWSPP